MDISSSYPVGELMPGNIFVFSSYVQNDGKVAT